MALAVGALLPVASPALAHDALLGSEPAGGAVVTEAPSQIVLTFAATQAGVGSEVAVIGPDAGAWTDGPAQVVEAVVTQPLRAGMPDGAYTVTWRSVSGDGHPVSGTFGFVVDAGGEAAVETAAVVETATVLATAAAVAEEPTDDATTTAASATTAAPAVLGWLAASGVAVLAAVALVLALRRRSVVDE